MNVAIDLSSVTGLFTKAANIAAHSKKRVEMKNFIYNCNQLLFFY
jgi:hypothetical protein